LLQLRDEEIYFCGAHTGGEVDLFFLRRGKRWGVEIKYASSPKRTAVMEQMISAFNIRKLYIVYAGKQRYTLSKTIEAIPISMLISWAQEFNS